MSIDPVWERIHSSREWGKYPPEELVRFVANRYYRSPDRAAVAILDVGCGLGSGVWYVAREGFRSYGIDGAPSAIARLRDRLAADGLSAELNVGDIVALGAAFQEATFDAVVDVTTVCCLRFHEAREVVRQVADLLKPGGRFFSMTFDVATWGYGEGRQVEPNGFTDCPAGPFKDRGFIRFYSRDELPQLYAALPIASVESTTRTMEGGRRVVKHWVTECQKPEG